MCVCVRLLSQLILVAQLFKKIYIFFLFEVLSITVMRYIVIKRKKIIDFSLCFHFDLKSGVRNCNFFDF